jgi:hypothetical protein
MDSFRVGDNMGPETLQDEYKQIVIPRDLWRYMDGDGIVSSRIMTPEFDKIVTDTISHYFSKYLPRYVASMSRTPGGTASLIFGIADDGTIVGYPTLEGITPTDIIAMIISTYRNMRGVRNGVECEDVKTKYIREINVSVKDLLSPETPVDLDDAIAESSRIGIEYNRTMAAYHTAMEAWRTLLAFYSSSLDVICSDSTRRALFLKYCEDRSAPEPIITKLRSCEEITFKLGTVTMCKIDMNSMEYWITEFKDHNMRIMVNTRPERPNIKRNAHLKTQLSHLKIMNGNWANNVRYQMIVINLRMNDDPTEWIEYRKNGEWVSSIRTTSACGDPCCEETFDCGYDGHDEIMFPSDYSE